MKVLNKKSFYLIIGGLLLYTLLQVISLVTVITQKEAAFQAAKEANSGLTDEQIRAVVNAGITFAAVIVVVCIIVAIFMIRACLKNVNEARTQGYITALFVISIIFLVFGAFNLITQFTVLALLGILPSIVILVGSILQRKSS